MSNVNATDVPVRIEVVGNRHPGIAEYAEKRVRAALRAVHRPVLRVQVRITHHEDPAVARPVVAQADVDVNGRPVRAQATGTTGLEAVDLLHDRLRRRLERDRSRSGGHWEDRRGHRPPVGSGGSHPGEPPANRLPHPESERVVVPHRSVTPHPCGVDEAVFDMEAMGYEFHLFTEEGSGQDSVVYTGPSGLRLAQVEPGPDELAPHVTPVVVSTQPAPVLDVAEAVEQLGLWDRPFLFFLDAERGRGALLHRRHDGHYGLVSPAG
jgi:ribosome-associated translation inhibitor RaiA